MSEERSWRTGVRETFPIHRAGGGVGAGETSVAAGRRDAERLWAWMVELERWGRAGYLAAGLAHEMGNLLTSLIARGELALMGTEAAEHAAALERNVEVARRAARLLKVFGEFARPASRESAPVPLTQVAEDALRLSRHALRKAGVETRLHRAGDDRLVAPADRLLQVVLALLHAAIEHTAPAGGGTVEVLVERIEDEVWLELSARATRPEAAGEAAVAEAGARDAGPGADASPSQAGTAELSLYVARRIVADLGGKLRTRRPGRGRWLYCLMLPAVGAAGAAPR